MIAAVAATHSAVWYLFGDRRLSARARQAIAAAASAGTRIAVLIAASGQAWRLTTSMAHHAAIAVRRTRSKVATSSST